MLALIAAVLALARPATAGTPLPVRLSDADPRWRLTDVGQETAPGLTLAAVAVHVGAPDRLLFVTAPGPGAKNADLDALGRRVVAAFPTYTCEHPHLGNAKRLGFAGRDWRFELAGAPATLECELFLFADAGRQWGILYTKPKDATGAASAAFGLLLPNVPGPPGAYAMKPVRIHNAPLTTFPISLQIHWAAGGDRVAAITITKVQEDSEAEREGLRVGDAIVAIDGRKTGDFTGGVGRDDALGQIFVDRRPGDHVTLEILSPGAATTFLVTLHTIWGADLESPFGFYGGR